MNIEECKFYDKETGCIECKQVFVQDLYKILKWQKQKLEKIEELADIIINTNCNYIFEAENILKIIRGEE